MDSLDAVAIVLRDLGVDARVQRDDAEYVRVRLPGESPVLIYAPEDEPPDLRDVADRAQDELVETAAHWGRALPLCPGHPHPARADDPGGEPWWVCPADERRIARIGELHQLR